MKKLGNKGMTLVEVMAAMVILAIVCGGMLTIVVTSSKANTNSSDKQFAANQASNITQLWLWYVNKPTSTTGETIVNLVDFTKIINGTDSTNSTKLDIEIAGCAKFESKQIIIYYTADKIPILVTVSNGKVVEPTNAIYKIVITQNTITINENDTNSDEIQENPPNFTISIEVFKKHKETWDKEPFYNV